MVAKLALQAAKIAPSPLRVRVMLTANLFMLSETFSYTLKRVLTLSSIGIWWQLFIYGLICHVRESFLMPERTIACLPY